MSGSEHRRRGRLRWAHIDRILLARAPSRPDAEHPVGGRYVERYYLPAVGPGSIALLRFADELLTLCDERPTRVQALDLGRSVGLGGPGACLAADRLHSVLFLDMIEEGDTLRLGVPAMLPPARASITSKWSLTVAGLAQAEGILNSAEVCGRMQS